MGAAAAGLVLALCVTLATAAGVPRPTVLLLDGGSKRAAAVLSLRRAAAQLQAALGDGREDVPVDLEEAVLGADAGVEVEQWPNRDRGVVGAFRR